jgi:hypothetical protein
MKMLWLRFGYRKWARLLHRFNLHHTRHIGPLEPGGGFVERCEWCGISRAYGGSGLKFEAPDGR